MSAKFDRDAIKQRFEAWWRKDLTEAPLINLLSENEPPVLPPLSAEDMYLNVEALSARYRDVCRRTDFLGDTFPYINLNIGAGSVALYLGCEPKFAKETVWFSEFVEDWEDTPLKFDENNYWWQYHQKMMKKAMELAGEDYYVSIPDLVENIDILSAMRGPQNTCYDLIDCPEAIERRIGELDDMYFKYYDKMYDIVRDPDGSSTYTSFHIIGKGKTAKVQCDFSAMMSPTQFKELIVPSLKKQCDALDYSLYHLDGPDALRHLPALMEIDSLKALQWTPGAALPEAADEQWFPVYDKVFEAGKSLWISNREGGAEVQIDRAKKLVKRYGIKGTYIIFGKTDPDSAKAIMKEYAKGFKG